MSVLIRKISTITEKGQTTVPKPVREALGLGYGGRIAFCIDENGSVTVERDEADEDPVIERFLAFMAQDMQAHPERAILDIPDPLRNRMERLTAGMTIDPDEPIDGDVAL